MKLTTTTQHIDRGLARIVKHFETMRARKSYVKVGVLGKKDTRDSGEITNAQLASIHEYGLGNVPARPFLRPPFEQNKAAYLEILRDAFAAALKSKGPEGYKRALALVGQRLATDIKNYVTTGEGVGPPLADSTIVRKGSSRPLVDTGQLIRSVDYEVID